MMVDVDSGLFSIVQMQRLTLLALVSHFRRFASCRRSALSAQPRLSGHSNKCTPILILGGHYDPNSSTCFIRL